MIRPSSLASSRIVSKLPNTGIAGDLRIRRVPSSAFRLKETMSFHRFGIAFREHETGQGHAYAPHWPPYHLSASSTWPLEPQRLAFRSDSFHASHSSYSHSLFRANFLRR